MNGVIKRSDPADDYEFIQKVGHGTYGEVYKSKHVRTSELAAIKIIKLEAGDNFTAIQHEILVLMDCKHPNIISYYGSYLKRDKLWIVMEYCSGGSLQDIYQMTGPLTELQIAFVCRETLKGLQYLHSLGKIHRDIKGANILLTRLGDIKLADFGVAAQITATIGKRKSIIGTPYWMAPEVANVEQRGGYGVECDVWAVGITSIELAELQPPMFDLNPMQVLYQMTKSSYKVPKLADKKKWSSTFHDFIKNCLTKNPKKRPSPTRLLNSHPFVAGALSSRLTKELLDRVNNPGIREKFVISSDSEELLNEELPKLNVESCLMRSYYEKGTLLAKDSISFDDDNQIDYVINDENLENQLINVQKNCNYSNVKQNEKNSDCSISVSISSNSNDTLIYNNNNNNNNKMKKLLIKAKSFGEERSLSLGAFHNNNNNNNNINININNLPFQTKLIYNNNNKNFCYIKKRKNFKSGIQMQPLSARPQTIFGLVPTPQVSMGACFFNILHNCTKQINCCATWTHPASQKKYLIIGAEEGIFTLDLFELHNNTLTMIHERKCSWLYVIDDIMIALQGKTPYLYRHNILQLMQQQLITQKITKTMTRIPEKYKPKVLLTTIRMPETKDCFKCCVERSVINGNIYMGCIIPNAVLLFQWYEPLSRFIMIKRVDIDFGLSARSLLKSSSLFCSPFSLIFRTNANADLPLICVGVTKKGNLNVEKTNKKINLQLNFVDFNDTGKLEHFLSRSIVFDTDANTLVTNNPFLCQNKDYINVVNLKQLDRETLFLAYENKILITDLEGNEKITDLMKTSFTFDFPIDFAVPLPDSVLAFHRHGIQGQSFFRGSITQDLYDHSKTYNVIGNDSLIVLKCRSTTSINDDDCDLTLLPTIFSLNNDKNNLTQQQMPNCDLCILTGHISTLTPP